MPTSESYAIRLKVSICSGDGKPTTPESGMPAPIRKAPNW